MWLLVSSASLALAQPRVERALAQAEREAARGRPARAIPHLRRAIRVDPGDPRAVLRWAELALPADPGPEHQAPLAGAAEIARALEAYLAERARDGDQPARARAAAERAWAAALAGDHGAEIDRVAAAAGLQDATSAAALRRLAGLAIVRDDLAGAQRALEAARRAVPQDPEVLSDLATVLLARGRASDALVLYQGVVARRPGDLEALRDLAGARVASGDAIGAVRVLETVARQVPDRADVLIDLARARMEAGDPRGAADTARAALAVADGGDAEPAILLGQALAATGARAEARAAFEEALRRRPGSPRAQEGIRALER